MRHHQPRQPKKTHGFSWGRSLRDGLVIYRLFRRDQHGALHMKMLTYPMFHDRRFIAADVNRARHALRDQVDVVDLALMGISQ